MLARWRSKKKHARGQLSRLVNFSFSPIAGSRLPTDWCPCLQQIGDANQPPFAPSLYHGGWHGQALPITLCHFMPNLWRWVKSDRSNSSRTKKRRGQHISIKCNPINIGECRFAANFLLHTELSTRNPNIWASVSSQARKSLHCIRSHKFPRNTSSRIW